MLAARHHSLSVRSDSTRILGHRRFAEATARIFAAQGCSPRLVEIRASIAGVHIFGDSIVIHPFAPASQKEACSCSAIFPR
jgi:hypothetical protein